VKDGVRLHGTYRCTSGVRVGDRVFHNYESEAYGPIGLAKALEVSCDTVFYRFAYRAWKRAGGPDAPLSTTGPFVDMARAFGLGSSTGVDLPGESAGRIADRQWKHDRWVESRDETCRRAREGYPQVEDRNRARYLRALARDNCRHGGEYRPGDAVNFAIGQGDTAVTPLQMAVVYAAVANGGTLWTPHVGAAVRTPAGRTVRTIEPERAGRVDLAPDLVPQWHSGLAAVVRKGTAAGAFSGFPLDDYPLAGKTGTAEVFRQDATSWFASYGPTTDPRYAVVVVVPQGGTGASTAAPAVRQIWEAIRRSGR
jgi:penicillin-binding protein 2